MASLGPDLVVNLAREAVFLEFCLEPRALEERILGRPEPKLTVFIDEVQRLPSLLNTVQALIDEHRDAFVFSSPARAPGSCAEGTPICCLAE